MLEFDTHADIQYLTAVLSRTNLHSPQGWRLAGGLEILLQQVGAIKENGQLLQQQSGGRKYLFGLIDRTWRETYPECIFRIAQTYLAVKDNQTDNRAQP